MNISELNKLLNKDKNDRNFKGTDVARVKRDGNDITLLDEFGDALGKIDEDNDLFITNNKYISGRSLKYLYDLSNTELSERLKEDNTYNIIIFKDDVDDVTDNEYYTALKKDDGIDNIVSCDSVTSSKLSNANFIFTKGEIEELIQRKPEYADIIKKGMKGVN